MSLSAKNGWIDKNGRVYIIFMEDWSMGVSLNQPSRVRDEGSMDRKPLL